MKTMRGIFSKVKRGRRGVLLAVALFMVSIVTISSVLMVQGLIFHQRANYRRMEVYKALNNADNGASIIQHWGNPGAVHPPSIAGLGDFQQISTAMTDFGTNVSDAGTGTLPLTGISPTAMAAANGATALLADMDLTANPTGYLMWFESPDDTTIILPNELSGRFPYLYLALVAAGGRFEWAPDVLQQVSTWYNSNNANLNPSDVNATGSDNNTGDIWRFSSVWRKPDGISQMYNSGQLVELEIARGPEDGPASPNGNDFSTVPDANPNAMKEQLRQDWANDVTAPNSWNRLEYDLAVRSVGISTTGISRTQITFLEVNPIISITIDAALTSFVGIALNGNFKVHWGEAWSVAGTTVMAKNQYSYVQNDPLLGGPDTWAAYRTMAAFSSWGGAWAEDTTAPYNLDRLSSMSTAVTNLQPGLFPDLTGNWKDVFYQHDSTLQFPDFSAYDDYFKQFAMSRDRYYSTDASGNIYHRGIEDIDGDGTADPNINDNPNFVPDFHDEFGVGATYVDAVADFVYIDTIDGLPPAADNSNLATISINGNGDGLKGFFWINANMKIGGTGNPPTLYNAEDPTAEVAVDAGNAVPDSSQHDLPNVFLNGLMYSSGSVQNVGQPKVYGAWVAQDGFTGGGTPDVYYNWRLKDGLVLDEGLLGSRLRRVYTIHFGTPAPAVVVVALP